MSRHLLVALAVVLVALPPSWGKQPSDQTEKPATRKRPERVQVSATITERKKDGRLTVAVKLRIAKGWFIFANPVGIEDLADSQTRVAFFRGEKNLDEVRITYPAGRVVEDCVVGNYRIYEREVVVTATVRRAKGDRGPLQVSVRFRPMGKGHIALPEVKKVTVSE